MTYQLNITATQFDFIDFSESSVFMNILPELGQRVELYCWGITLLTSPHWGVPLRLPDIQVDKSEDTYIAGPAKVTFSDVIGGELKITLYDPDRPDSFLTHSDNTPVALRRRWEFDPQADSLFVYELDYTSDWPPGAGYLALAARGQVWLTFEVSNCIPARQFVLNPQKYSQPGWKPKVSEPSQRVMEEEAE